MGKSFDVIALPHYGGDSAEEVKKDIWGELSIGMRSIARLRTKENKTSSDALWEIKVVNYYLRALRREIRCSRRCHVIPRRCCGLDSAKQASSK